MIRKIFISIIFIFCLANFVLADENNQHQLKIVVNIPSHSLELFDNNTVIKAYTVGVGRNSFPTPIGNFFKIISMVKEPKWQNPYKSYSGFVIKEGFTNPLSTRWMGFYIYRAGEYGIHGTNNPKSVGKYSSHGCIRMYSADAEDLFERIQLGTPVVINNFDYKVSFEQNHFWVKRYSLYYKQKLSPYSEIQTQFKYFGKEFNFNEQINNKINSLKVGERLMVDD